MKLRKTEIVFIIITLVAICATVIITNGNSSSCEITTVQSEQSESEKQDTQIETSSVENSSTPDMELININTATKNELSGLNGIGEVIAQRIIDFRDKYGEFTCKEDIMDVKGIGIGTYSKIQDSICIG